MASADVLSDSTIVWWPGDPAVIAKADKVIALPIYFIKVALFQNRRRFPSTLTSVTHDGGVEIIRHQI